MLSICLMAVSLVLPIDKKFSESYTSKFLNGMHQQRVSNCMMLVELSQKMNTNPALVLAIASHESGFLNNQVSSAGAVGLLGVMPSLLSPDERSQKMMAIRGIEIFNSWLDIAGGSICEALSKYNAGGKGSCKNGGRGRKYANLILDRWYKICIVWDKEEECSDY